MFLPGILATLIIDALTFHKERNNTRFVIHSFILGILSHLLYGKINFNKEVNLIEAISNFDNLTIQNFEIFWPSVIGVIIGILVTYIVRNRFLYKIANLIRLSNKMGQDDAWEYIMAMEKTEWIYVRNETEGVIYLGKIDYYSTDNTAKELILNDVDCFEKNSESSIHIDKLYMQFNNDDAIIIEIATQEEKNDE